MEHIVWGHVEPCKDNSSSSLLFEQQIASGVQFLDASSSSGKAGDVAAPREDEASAPPTSADTSGYVAADAVEETLTRHGLWSRGAGGHGTKSCRPCLFMTSRVGCRQGTWCSYCHLPHTEAQKGNPNLGKRVLCKKAAEVLEDLLENHGADVFTEASQLLAGSSPYLQSIMDARARESPGRLDVTTPHHPKSEGASSGGASRGRNIQSL